MLSLAVESWMYWKDMRTDSDWASEKILFNPVKLNVDIIFLHFFISFISNLWIYLFFFSWIWLPLQGQYMYMYTLYRYSRSFLLSIIFDKNNNNKTKTLSSIFPQGHSKSLLGDVLPLLSCKTLSHCCHLLTLQTCLEKKFSFFSRLMSFWHLL